MHAHHLHFKLKLRQFLMRHRDHRSYRTQVLGNFRLTPMKLFEEVVSACVAEGTITISPGPHGGEILTWNEAAVREV